MNFQANKLLQTIIKKVPESERERERVKTHTYAQRGKGRGKNGKRGRRHSSQWKIWDIEKKGNM